jgi:hypothetical protein
MSKGNPRWIYQRDGASREPSRFDTLLVEMRVVHGEAVPGNTGCVSSSRSSQRVTRHGCSVVNG